MLFISNCVSVVSVQLKKNLQTSLYIFTIYYVPLRMPINGGGQTLVVGETIDELFESSSQDFKETRC